MKIIFISTLIATIFCDFIISQESECIDSIYYDTNNDAAYDNLYKEGWYINNADWQKGFIVMENEDTLFGDVMMFTNGTHIRFKNELINKKIRADKYKSFKYGNRLFVSKNFDGYPFNVELIENGRLCFYAYEQNAVYPGFSKYFKAFYIEKGKNVYGPFALNWTDNITKKAWIYDCFGDYQSLISIMEQKTLRFQDILKACKAYNCWYNKTYANNVYY